tara:strand:+ start:1270 stop:1602 length:333 start_codon:yes stop_codon:yes gene_type:complete
LKGAEKDTIKDIKANSDEKEGGYDHAELMSAIKGVSLTPAANGLNAAAAAGVDIAHQVLAKSSAMNPVGVYVKIGAEANPKGLTATGMLDDDDEEDKLKKKDAKSEKSKK